VFRSVKVHHACDILKVPTLNSSRSPHYSRGNMQEARLSLSGNCQWAGQVALRDIEYLGRVEEWLQSLTCSGWICMFNHKAIVLSTALHQPGETWASETPLIIWYNIIPLYQIVYYKTKEEYRLHLIAVTCSTVVCDVQVIVPSISKSRINVCALTMMKKYAFVSDW
jgi:hypothetical protein